MQKKKKLCYTIKLCFKLTYLFKKTKVSITCDPLSYTSLLNTSNIVFLGNELVYKRSTNNSIVPYTIHNFFSTLFDIHEEFKWLYLRERRRYSYNNLQYGPFINEFYFFFFKKIYYYYRFFYNSFFVKAHYAKNYDKYRSSYLIEYLWKFHFPYENTYFPSIFTEYQRKFGLYREFFKNDIIFGDDNYQLYGIEFFCFKKKFFHNSFYNFFYRTNSYIFSDNLNLPVATDKDTLHGKFFYDYLDISIEDNFSKTDINLDCLLEYKNTQALIKIYYAIFILLVI